MKLIDTHAHLQFHSYDADRDEVAERNSSDLEALVNVGTSLESSEKSIELSKKYVNFYSSLAVHPHHAEQFDKGTLDRFEKLIVDPKVVAIGEIGLDKHTYKSSPLPDLRRQKEIMHEQIALAVKYKKPVLFHCRLAYDELYEEIKHYSVTGLMHCFMGTWEQTKNFLSLGLSISFAGNLTYKGNDHMREAAKKIPEESLLVETDSPFLAPEPLRGSRNEPIHVKIVAKQLASLRGWDEEKTAAITSRNAKALLNI